MFKRFFSRLRTIFLKVTKRRTIKPDSRVKKISVMNIATKILAGFLIIAAMSTAMGVYAASSLKDVNNSSKELYQDILQPTKNTATVLQSFEQECVILRQGLISEDTTMLPAIISTLNNNNQKIASGITSVKALITQAKQDQIKKVETAYASYKPLLESAVTSIQAGDKAAVIEDLAAFGQLRTAEMALEDALESLMAAVTSDAAAMSTKNNQTADSVFTVTVIAVGVVLGLSVLIGAVIAKGISRPVKKLTENVKKLAAGETDIALSKHVSNDEIGQMNGAFQTILKVIKELESDTDMLIDAAMKGDLSKRADASKHRGTYRRIVDGINATLDAMLGPINESANVLSSLAMGHLDICVSGDFHGDFAIIKNALNNTAEKLKSYIQDITYVLSEMSQGHLNVQIASEFEGDFAALKESLNESIRTFFNVLANINKAAEEVSLGTEQLSASSQDISQGASVQANAVEAFTTSISELAHKTKDNAKNARTANDLLFESKTAAQNGNTKIQAMLTAMNDINESSMHISKIVKVIDDIAFQTNILALNAAVEAARAGFHGKGFAVVANEVRNLAAKSAQAAKETSQLIDASMNVATSGTNIANETADALLDIVTGVEKIVDISIGITASSDEQATEIEQINNEIMRLSTVVQNNTATSEEVASASEEIAAQAVALKEMVDEFILA